MPCGPGAAAHRWARGIPCGSGRPDLGEARPHVLEEQRQRLGLADDRQEVGVASPPRHDVLVQVGGHPRAGDPALVHPDVEAHRSRGPGECGEGGLGHRRELGGLLVGEVDVEGDVPIGADEQVARVVGEEVHDDEAQLTASDDQPFDVAAQRGCAERAPVAGLLGGPDALDVGHPMRRPQPLEPVLDARKIARALKVGSRPAGVVGRHDPSLEGGFGDR
jgi:hypothetical protein